MWSVRAKAGTDFVDASGADLGQQYDIAYAVREPGGPKAVSTAPCLAEARPPLGSAIMRDKMSKLGAAFVTALMFTTAPLVATPVSAAEAPHRIARDASWGCRDKSELLDLLFLGISASFDTKLASALADGRCVYFMPGETVTILEDAGHGVVKVQRGGAGPIAYWTPLRNINPAL